jgi:hypothetical protein
VLTGRSLMDGRVPIQPAFQSNKSIAYHDGLTKAGSNSGSLGGKGTNAERPLWQAAIAFQMTAMWSLAAIAADWSQAANLARKRVWLPGLKQIQFMGCVSVTASRRAMHPKPVTLHVSRVK